MGRQIESCGCCGETVKITGDCGCDRNVCHRCNPNIPAPKPWRPLAVGDKVVAIESCHYESGDEEPATVVRASTEIRGSIEIKYADGRLRGIHRDNVRRIEERGAQ